MRLHRFSLLWGTILCFLNSQFISENLTDILRLQIPRSQLWLDRFYCRYIRIEESCPHVVIRNFAIYHYHVDWRADLSKCLGGSWLALGIWHLHDRCASRGHPSMYSVLLEPAESKEERLAYPKQRTYYNIDSKAILH